MVVYNNVLAGAAGQSGDAGYKIERSLRFNRPDTPSLSKTFSSAGNQTTWTWSAWVKRADVTVTQSLFSCYAGTDNNDGYVNILFNAQNKLSFSGWSGSYAITNREFRDTSAWYHIVIAVDQTQSNTSDRIKIYVNGVAETFSTYSASRSSYPIGSAIAHNIGSNAYYSNTTNKLQGYLAEVHFVDGQQLAPTDFGEVNADTGAWDPIEYTGVYNAKHFNDWNGDTTGTGYNSSTGKENAFDGSDSTQAAPGQGGTMSFTPSTAITGISKIRIKARRDAGQATDSNFTLNGTTIGNLWTAGTTATVEITSLGGNAITQLTNLTWKANTNNAEWFGVYQIEVYYDGAYHTLVQGGVNSFHLDFSTPSALGNDAAGSNNWTVNNIIANVERLETSAISSISGNTLTFTDSTNLNKFSAGDVIQEVSDAPKSNYPNSQVPTNPENAVDGDINTHTIFSSQSGSSSDWYVWTLPYARSYTTLQVVMSGSAASGNDVYIGASNGTQSQATNQFEGSLTSTATAYTLTNMPNPVKSFSLFLAGGNYSPTFKLHGLIIDGSYVKTVTAASVSVANNQIVSEAGGDWATGRTAVRPAVEGDDMLDSPTNYDDGTNVGGNYAVLNPLANSKFQSRPLSNGNLDFTGNTSASSGYPTAFSTIGMTSGKFYCEATVHNSTDTNGVYVGVCDKQMTTTEVSVANTYPGGPGGNAYSSHGRMEQNSSVISTGNGNYTGGDVIGIAYDADNGKLYFSKNGTFVNSANPAGGTNPNLSNIAGEQFFVFGGYQNRGLIVNFGQRPFNTDPPTGFKALCTQNLDDPLIADGSDYFDTVLYTGTGAAKTVSGLNLSPDMAWIKERNGTSWHRIIDVVRGQKEIFPNATNAESSFSQGLNSFNSDGFTLGTGSDSNVNTNNNTYVGWLWDAGSSNTTISTGSLNSSAYNQDQNWGPGSTVTGSWAFSDTVAAAFDGDLTTKSRAAANQATTIDLPADVAFTSTVKLTGSVDNAGGQIYIKDGTNSFVNVSSGFNQSSTVNTVDITSLLTSPIKEIKLDSVGNGYARMAGIEVDGKLLVSSSATPPSVPSIASTVRANPTAGFSIINHVGTGAAGTFGHGLNAAPEFLIFKNRDATDNWFVWSKAADGTATTGGILNSSNAFFTGSANELNSTLPTSNVISVAGNLATNGNNQDVITYAFAPVDQYSSFGSFQGNGSADGPFVYTGFKTRWLMIKSSSNSGEDWLILDTARDTYNDGNSSSLYASLSHADNSTTMITTDILSNGFKPRATNAAINASGYTYIYAAFAENPFKYARAR